MGGASGYTDPDGEFVVTAAVAIGIAFGAFSGYSMGQAKGASGWQLAGYTLGGAGIGGLSAGVGTAISTTGAVGANTIAIIGASTTNSMGQKVLSGGESDFVVSFGVGSYNIDSGEFGHLGKGGNSKGENIGYGLGLFANLSDGFAIAKGAYGENVADVNVVVNNDPPISHIAVTTPEGKTLISYGPNSNEFVSNKQFAFGGTKGLSTHPSYFSENSMSVVKMRVRNIRVDKMQQFAFNKLLNNDYSILRSGGYSCVSAASSGLWHAGFFHIPFINTPITLEMQIFISNNIFLSSFMTNKN